MGPKIKSKLDLNLFQSRLWPDRACMSTSKLFRQHLKDRDPTWNPGLLCLYYKLGPYAFTHEWEYTCCTSFSIQPNPTYCLAIFVIGISNIPTLRKTASALGMDRNIYPPTKSISIVLGRAVTTCGRSRTVHLMCGKALTIVMALSPVPRVTGHGSIEHVASLRVLGHVLPKHHWIQMH